VNLTWEGKAEALAALGAPIPRIVPREELPFAGELDPRPGDIRAAHPKRTIVHGDALHVARALSSQGWEGKADLIYLDPPYGSGVDYRMDDQTTGEPAIAERNGSRTRRAVAYGDRWEEGAASHLDMLLPRLYALQPLLKPTGSIWIQVDWRAGYLVRALCDEIFGRDRFLNEIVWRRAPNLGRQARSGQFGRTLDALLVYGASARARLVPPSRLSPIARRVAQCDAATGRYFTLAPRGDYTDASVAKLEQEGRIYRTSKGKIAVKYWLEQDAEGRLFKRQPVDALWADVPPLRHGSPSERTGYPTQKPRALLDRIVQAGSLEGGLVIDLFAGSGTTGAAAAALGRSFILADTSPVAFATMRSRLLREGAPSLSVQDCGAEPPLAPLRVDVDPIGGTQWKVELACPDQPAPVAWAISLSEAEPFRIDWHAERGTGRHPPDLCRVATVPRSPVVRARAYFADGTIGQTCLHLTTAQRAEPMLGLARPPTAHADHSRPPPALGCKEPA
jgi:DNA modification methylase